ncbi:Cytochrome b2, mitochondrial [Purpureocillium lavendulum]|uniref:Cytochrome b2, mitochondrial n=1 Tax=Purpureocillium lavendulum TaxID=1247861 RepID=A0AB34FH16_9HYPO|nr:Cytochrome b2, mitochondrial [Purpureocillium lavendulum]
MAGNGFECLDAKCDPRQISQTKGTPCPKCGAPRNRPLSEHATVPPGPDMWYPMVDGSGGKYYLDGKKKYTKSDNGDRHYLRRQEEEQKQQQQQQQQQQPVVTSLRDG